MVNRILLFVVIAAMGSGARADDEQRLRAVPWVFVGHADDCAYPPGTPYPPGSNIVTSAWLRGMGLPDKDDTQLNTTQADTLPGSPGASSRRDPHYGLLLNKNGPTRDCSSAGANIRGAEGISADPLPNVEFILGFDYRNGTHCGAGSPRFNVYTRQGSERTFHFIGGCANGVPTPAPQDPTEWTRVRFTNAVAFPPIAAGSTFESIDLIVDEGTDSASVEDPRGVGLSVVDNIYVNGQYIRRGSGIAEPDGDHNQGD